MVDFIKCIYTVLSPFSYFAFTLDSAELCACVVLLTHGRVLCLSRKTTTDALFTAVVQCCRRAAVIVLHSSVFPPKLPVAICTHSLLPKGFSSNKIMYLTT